MLRVFRFLVVPGPECFVYRLGELVRAGGAFALALDSGKLTLDFLHSQTFRQSGESLGIAVAALYKLYLLQDISIQFNLDMGGAGTSCLIRVYDHFSVFSAFPL